MNQLPAQWPQIKSKDDATVQYSLFATGASSPALQDSLKGKGGIGRRGCAHATSAAGRCRDVGAYWQNVMLQVQFRGRGAPAPQGREEHMKRNEARVALLTLAVLLGMVTNSIAQTGVRQPTGASKSSHTENQASREQSSGGPHEGIKVHGHWTIVVHNKDGSVASRNEFENALSPSPGSALLVGVLGRSTSVGPWLINLGGNVCFDGYGNPASCVLVESAFPIWSAPMFFPTLKVAPPQSSSGPTVIYSLVLSGTAKAAATGAITNVDTAQATCAGNVTPAVCATTQPPAQNQFGSPFTSHTLGTAIPVQAGQSIDVTVVLSFT